MNPTTRNLTIAWLGGIPIAIINGLARNNLYAPHVSELLAHQISSISGIILFGLYFWVLNLRWPMTKTGQSLLIGFNWLLLTILFEFIFGHYVIGHSWEKLLFDYNIFKGRLWSLVLFWTFIGPYTIYQLSKII
jgi:hypothetical protein